MLSTNNMDPVRRAPYPVHMKRGFLHSAYWLAVTIFFAAYFGQKPGDFVQNLAYAAGLLPVTVLTTYAILHGLIPRYLLRARYFRFSLYLIYALIVSIHLELMLIFGLYMTVSDYQAMVVRPDFPGIVEGLLTMYLFVVVAVAAHLARRSYALKQQHAALERVRLETELKLNSAQLKLKEAELTLLKSQIQPHFLFNALNSLYALALERSTETPELILKLSTLLDYVLYRASADSVQLAQELDMLTAYIELESVRHGEGCSIVYQLPDPVPEAKVAPLLILPLVENAFKHGIWPHVNAGGIDIRIRVDGKRLCVRVQNTLASPPMDPDDGIHPGRTRQSGIGLRNLTERLEHLYSKNSPDDQADYILDINQQDGLFLVDLEVPLS